MSPFRVVYPRPVVPVGNFVVYSEATGMQPVDGSRAAGESVRGGGGDVPVASAGKRHEDHEAACHSEQEHRERGERVHLDHDVLRTRARPARMCSEQPRGLPWLTCTVAVPGSSRGNLRVELAFIVFPFLAGWAGKPGSGARSR